MLPRPHLRHRGEVRPDCQDYEKRGYLREGKQPVRITVAHVRFEDRAVRFPNEGMLKVEEVENEHSSKQH
uniref:SHSP domain-containing protein n=1 Tax=Steinernema glaseri TaxID=37863 RepID=A0A1I7YHQ0_9BILA